MRVPTTAVPAHAVRAATRPFHPAAEGLYDQAADDILTALVGGAMRDFDLKTSAVVTGGMVEGRILIRLDGRTWALPSFEAALLSIRIRLEPGLRGADLFADAFCMASRQAEDRVSQVHDWSAGVRPTEDVE